MLRRRSTPEETVTIYIDGTPATAAVGDSVAAVLMMAAGTSYRQSAVGGSSRAPYCMIGNCFDCLVEVDGVPNRQGCLITVREGMRISRQTGKAEVRI